MAVVDPVEYLKESESGRVVYNQVYSRCHHRNKHFVGAITGREGDGKSWTSLTLSKLVDPTFTVDRVFFRLDNLLEAVRDWDLPAGSALVIDESGVSLGSRTWYDSSQVIVNQVLQLIRSENLAFFLTLPAINELDSQARTRLHARIEMLNVDPQANQAKLKWHELEPRRGFSDGDPIKRFPSFEENGRQVKLTSLTFPAPPKELRENYEEKKSTFQYEQYTKAIEQLRDGEGDGDEKKPRELATAIAGNGLEAFVSRHNQTKQPYINKELIRTEYDLSHANASAVKSLLEQQFGPDDLESLA